MRTFGFLVMATLIVGAAVSAGFYWLLNYPFQDASIIGVSSALAGLVTEYARMFWKRKKRTSYSNINSGHHVGHL